MSRWRSKPTPPTTGTRRIEQQWSPGRSAGIICAGGRSDRWRPCPRQGHFPQQRAMIGCPSIRARQPMPWTLLVAFAALVALTPEPAHAAPALDGTALRWPWALPFIGILLTIATGPLLFPKIWHRHYC